jgi:putative FmdB family regulatory protein
MPIYEYRCSACGYQNDYLQKLSEPPLTDCPECGKSTFAKQVTAAGFQLKGTGWYATDFKNNGAGKGGTKPVAAKGKGEGEGGKADAAKSGTGPTEAGKSDSGSAASGGAGAPASGASPSTAST